MDSFDAIVVGAGPAGLTAAKTLAEAKLNVLCLDKKQEIGVPKRCAEGLGGGWFERLGLKEDKSWAVQEIYGAALYAPSGKQLEIRFDKVSGHVLERRIFEKVLAKKAVKSGASMKLKTPVTDVERKDEKVTVSAGIGEDKRDYSAPLIIACDGVETQTARKLGLNTVNNLNDIDSGYQYEMTGIEFEHSDLINLFFGVEVAPRGYCLTGDTEIIARNTVKTIASVGVGEEVLTLDGWMPVSEVSERDYAGEIVEVIPFMFNSKVKLTADHLVWVWNKKNEYEWKQAGELARGVRGSHRNGDYLVYPIPKEEKIDFIDVDKFYKGIEKDGYIYPKGRNQFGAVFPYKYGIRKRLKISDDLLELFGYFVSEGNDNSNGIIISNCDSKIIERVKEIGKKEFGIKPSLFVQTGENRKPCTQVHLGSVILKKMFSSLFGSGCKNKKLPSFLLGLDENQKKSFLKGLFLGDGSVEKSSEGYDVLSYISISKTLVHDLWMLLASMDIVGAIGKNKKKNAWRLRIRGKQLSKLSHLFGKLKYGGRPNRGFFVKDNSIFMGIRSLKNSFYAGKVYDIESGGSFCPFFAVHNCWIFPKGKDTANVGIGIGGTVERTAKSYLDKFVQSHDGLRNGSIIEVNAGAIPVGGFLEDMTRENLLVAGDAAHQVNPIHGGGIGLAIEGAMLASEVAIEAHEKKNYSHKFLQKYNPLWYEKRGNQLKGILKRRHMLEAMKDEDFEVLVESITGEDVLKIAEGDLLESVKIVGKKLVKNPGLAKIMLKYLK